MISLKKIFITGISGCVGHYLFDQLVKEPNYHLYLLVRNPDKMLRKLSDYPNVTVIKDEMRNINQYADVLREMDCVVHLAAGWGESEANYDYTIDFFSLLNPEKCRKVIYFSTASILGPNNALLEEAGKIGTCYITSKYRCCQKISQLKIYDRIITLFPTWVLGGDKTHPYSHAMTGIAAAPKWLWLLRFLSIDLRFHFIHAEDIASITAYLLSHENTEKKYVLGNSPITAEELIDEMCAYYNVKRGWRLKITPAMVRNITNLLRRPLCEWDLYCIERKDFTYKTVNAASFMLPSRQSTIRDVIDLKME